MNNTSVDSYLQDGCGRCERFQTPECVVHLWAEPLVALRKLLQSTELVEEMKWGSPCYTLDGKNVIMLASRKDACAMSFMKGLGLTDEKGLLEKPGPNTRVARLVKFQSLRDVQDALPHLQSLIAQAIELERAGKEIIPEDQTDAIPEELTERLDNDPELAQAFEALTPGRKRSYYIHISGAKQSATRARRVEKCIPKILAGKGFHDR